MRFFNGNLENYIELTKDPGTSIPPNYKCEKVGEEYCVPLEKPENYVGLQCSTWSESLMTDDQLLIQIFPRLFACAERAANPRPDFRTAETTEFQEKFTKKCFRFLTHFFDK